MRLVLLSGANPKIAVCGPSVRLKAGTWNIEQEGVVDSKLSLLLDGKDYEIPLQGVKITIGTSTSVKFVKRGSESYISVFAELINGT